jgi:hypothetical protein
MNDCRDENGTHLVAHERSKHIIQLRAVFDIVDYTVRVAAALGQSLGNVFEVLDI